MKTNDLKKGHRVVLNNGWFATIADNKKGNIRMAVVEGLYLETGSVYAHDIMFHDTAEGVRVRIQHTPAQLKLMKTVQALI